jgi:hypothetical protein
MEYLIWAVTLWLMVFIFIPVSRFRQLWLVAVLSPLLLFIMNYTFTHLGYYQFTRSAVTVAGVPVFILLGGAAGGLLLMNWVQRGPLSKIVLVLLFSGLIVLATEIYLRLNAFIMLGGFNQTLHFFVNVAGLSVLVWLSLAAVGEETVYKGNEISFLSKKYN